MDCFVHLPTKTGLGAQTTVVAGNKPSLYDNMDEFADDAFLSALLLNSIDAANTRLENAGSSAFIFFP